MKQNQEEGLRQEAVRRHLLGESPQSIYLGLNRSRFWFYKWLRRYQSGEPEWFKAHSRRPHRQPQQLPPETEKLVIEIRQRLVGSRYAQIGAVAIQWEMKKLGIEPLPLWSINRILKRKGLIFAREKRPVSGVKYPEIGWEIPGSVHQMDVVGPRYLKGDGRFYSHNLIDAYSHQISLFPSRTESDEAALAALIKAWKSIGMPDFLQLDNALYYRGSNRWPRSFGPVIRFCLSLGVQPVFIPQGEPWRQGVLEKFNDVYDKQFFRSQWFDSFAHLREQSLLFEQFHNENHRYSVLGGRTPNQVVEEERRGEPLPLPSNYQLPQGKIPLLEGYIHLVRFLRSDKILNVFGEKFHLPQAPAYEYVVATICVKAHSIKVKLDDRLIEEIYYPLPVDW